MSLHADKADYNHWNRQVPSKPIIHSQGFLQPIRGCAYCITGEMWVQNTTFRPVFKIFRAKCI